jgi:hypothetical protein
MQPLTSNFISLNLLFLLAALPQLDLKIAGLAVFHLGAHGRQQLLIQLAVSLDPFPLASSFASVDVDVGALDVPLFYRRDHALRKSLRHYGYCAVARNDFSARFFERQRLRLSCVDASRRFVRIDPFTATATRVAIRTAAVNLNTAHSPTSSKASEPDNHSGSAREKTSGPKKWPQDETRLFGASRLVAIKNNEPFRSAQHFLFHFIGVFAR